MAYETCSVCLCEIKYNAVVTECLHIFHKVCLEKYENHLNEIDELKCYCGQCPNALRCPMCRHNIQSVQCLRFIPRPTQEIIEQVKEEIKEENGSSESDDDDDSDSSSESESGESSDEDEGEEDSDSEDDSD